jgi:hypothetical protein
MMSEYLCPILSTTIIYTNSILLPNNMSDLIQILQQYCIYILSCANKFFLQISWKCLFSNLHTKLHMHNHNGILHWSTKILSHEDKGLYMMYFWILNSNTFPEFLYQPQLSCCIRLCESIRLHM